MQINKYLIQNFVARVCLLVSTFLVNLIFANLLNAAGSGELYYSINNFSIITLLASLSLESGNTYFLSKKEIANEELTTLNEELQSRNAELSIANNDLLNLLDNVSIPVVIVGNDLHIRHFTPPAQKLLNLLPGDIGRRLIEIRPNVELEDIGAIAREAIDSVSSLEREVREVGTGHWHLMRVRPYKTWDNKIEGAVLSFVDIDALKRMAHQAQVFAAAMGETAREAIVVLDGNLRVINANPAFYRKFGVSREETEQRAIYELGENASGDTFRVCYDLSGQAFPTEFMSPKGSTHYLVGYRRQKDPVPAGSERK